MLADAVPQPIAHEHRTDLRVSRFGAGFILWLGSYLVLALLDIWLWQRGASRELLFWEARRRLVIGGNPADLLALVATQSPLVLYLVLLTGSALNAAALLGATTITVLATLLRRAQAPWLWLLLLALSPTIVLSAFQYPSVLLRTLLLLVMSGFLLKYIRDNNAYQLCVAALALGALTLVDLQSWLLWLIVAAVLLVNRTRSRRELTTLGIVAFFPAMFMSAAWLYLRSVALGGGTGGTNVWSLESATRLSLWEWPALLWTIAILIPTYLLLLTLMVIYSYRLYTQKSSATQHTLATTLVFALPIADIVLRYATGQTRQIAALPLDAAVLMVALPLVMLPYLWQAVVDARYEHTSARWISTMRSVIGCLLLVSLCAGWASVAFASSGEPYQLLGRALAQDTAQQDSFQAVAQVINARLQPGQRVLFDDGELYPLVALLERSDALLLPYQLDYAIAIQHPADWARFVVITDTGRVSGLSLDDTVVQEVQGYHLVLQSGALRLYERQSLGTAPLLLAGGQS